MKKTRAIVFTLSSDLTFAVACVMLDIKRISPNLADEVVIFHDGISKNDQNLLSSILPCIFILYDFPIKDTSIFNQRILSYFTKMVFAKFECLKLLEKYSNVMLLDYDIVIQQDISELFAFCEAGIKMIRIETHKVRDQLNSAVDEYNMKEEGVAACVFILQDHIGNFKDMYGFCYKALKKFADKLYLPEQAIFDFMIQEFNLEICVIDYKIFSPHPTDKKLADNAKIIHAYGQPKFWNGLNNNQWEKNYTFWLKMGGSKYKQIQDFKGLVKKNIFDKIKFLGKIMINCFIKILNYIRYVESYYSPKSEFSIFYNLFRIRNNHNRIIPKNIFPIDLVNIGSYSYGELNLYAYDQTNKTDRLEIGNFVSISSNVKFFLHENHQTSTFSTFPLKSVLFNKQDPQDTMLKGSIVVHDEVWIGNSVIILSGVTIGKGAVIAAGAVVSSDVPPYAIAGGVPAKVIKFRFEEDVIKKMLPLKLIELSTNYIVDNIDLFYQSINDETIQEIENFFKEKK